MPNKTIATPVSMPAPFSPPPDLSDVDDDLDGDLGGEPLTARPLHETLYESHLAEHKHLFEVMLFLRHDIETTAQLLARCLKQGNKIMACGNGGSASDAQHFAAELVGRFQHDRDPLAALALGANAALLTCIGNDFGFEEIYARQVRAMGMPGDCLIGISTSGNSENVVRAMKAARKRDITTIALTGETGKLNRICQHVIAIPSTTTARIQEAHIFIVHTLCALIEAHLQHD